MDHPDFRVNGKIFATLWKDDGVVVLTREQQEKLVRSKPDVFTSAKGGWGQKGSTVVLLQRADQKSVREALSLAWNKGCEGPQTRSQRNALSHS
jgi:hypothetical protein